MVVSCVQCSHVFQGNSYWQTAFLTTKKQSSSMATMFLPTPTGSLENGGCGNTGAPVKLSDAHAVSSSYISYLVDKTTLSICNRWRHERGETELTLSDIGAQGGSPTS